MSAFTWVLLLLAFIVTLVCVIEGTNKGKVDWRPPAAMWFIALLSRLVDTL